MRHDLDALLVRVSHERSATTSVSISDSTSITVRGRSYELCAFIRNISGHHVADVVQPDGRLMRFDDDAVSVVAFEGDCRHVEVFLYTVSGPIFEDDLSPLAYGTVHFQVHSSVILSYLLRFLYGRRGRQSERILSRPQR